MDSANTALAEIQRQIMWNRLIAVVEEQAQVMIRTAFSTTVREAGDLSAGIFDLQGRMLAQAVTEFLTPPADDPAASGPTLLVAATTAAAAPDPGVAGPILDLAKWQAAQRSVPFTLLAPTYLPKGFTYAGKVPAGDGTYGIRVEGEMRPAVRMMYWYRGNLYLGISATTWTDAPLAGDGMVIQDNGTAYTLVGTLGTPDHVWWVKDKILYWVSDTLTYDVGQEDLLAVARSMRAVPVSGAVK